MTSEAPLLEHVGPELRPRVVESRSGLGRRSALGGLVVALALILSTLVIGAAVRDGGDTRADLTDRVDPAILQVQRLDREMSAQASAVREYASTADKARRTDYDRAATAEGEAADAASRLLRGVPGSGPSRAALGGVTSAMSAWRRDVAGAVLAHDGPTDLGGTLARTGDQRLDAARAALTTEETRLGALHRSTTRRLRSAVLRLYAALIAGASVLFLGAIALTTLVRRTLLRPVTELTERVRAVGAGDFGHPLDVSGPVEIAELSAHIDAMRDHIVEEWRKAAEAHVMLADQASELRRSNAELGSSNAELEQFAYVASHDLQEPLRNVASFCQLLSRRYSGVLDERGKQYIEYAVDGATRMQALIDDLLDFSRVGRTKHDMTVVDTEEVLRAALDDLGLARSETDTGITSDPMPPVTGDAVLLSHVFQNVIGNAIKFRGEDPPRVHLSVRRDGDMQEFACADNGIGIAPEQADRIFLVFQRLHPKGDYAGTGIGLALCRKVVEYHGGRIWLDTSPREGTMIRWTLPVVQEAREDEG